MEVHSFFVSLTNKKQCDMKYPVGIHIYIFEFKSVGVAEEALQQI